MDKICVSCGKSVYPMEQLKCLDQIWHKACFKCQVCNMTLNMKNYRASEKKPYCNAHYPQQKAYTFVSDNQEVQRVKQNTAVISKVSYTGKKNEASNVSAHVVVNRRMSETPQPQPQLPTQHAPGSINDFDPEMHNTVDRRLDPNAGRRGSTIFVSTDVMPSTATQLSRSESRSEQRVSQNARQLTEDEEIQPVQEAFQPQVAPLHEEASQPQAGPQLQEALQPEATPQPLPTTQPQPQEILQPQEAPQPQESSQPHALQSEAISQSHEASRPKTPQPEEVSQPQAAPQPQEEASQPPASPQYQEASQPKVAPQHQEFSQPQAAEQPQEALQSQSAPQHPEASQPQAGPQNQEVSLLQSVPQPQEALQPQADPQPHEPLPQASSQPKEAQEPLATPQHFEEEPQAAQIVQEPAQPLQASQPQEATQPMAAPLPMEARPHEEVTQPLDAPSTTVESAAPGIVNKPAIGERNRGRCFRAVFSYTAQDTDEVSFSEGDSVIHGDPIDAGWMYGILEKTGQYGMMPFNYMEEVQ